MTPEEQRQQWAALPPSTWLAGVDRERRFDIAIRWGYEEAWLAPLPCGVRWDALAVGDELGLTVLKILRFTPARSALGPVLHDRTAGLTYWLLPVESGAAARWREVDSTLQVLTAGDHLTAPTPEPQVPHPYPARWIHWPDVTGTLTPPDVLSGAISQALALEGS